MPKTWLILDATYLAHRAKHSTGGLSHNGEPTGVVFGFLRDLKTFADYHGTDRFVFCFDLGRSLREKAFPDYKKVRRERVFTPEETEEYDGFRRQERLLREEYLPRLGFRNVFSQKGYEADDLIASVCQCSLGEGDSAVIIGSDKDLYQCLSDRVTMWNPQTKKAYTQESLAKEYYGITPAQWVQVKGIAGCTTDEIPGVPGVGNKTAAKFVAGKQKKDSEAWRRIVSFTQEIGERFQLVTLPFPDTPKYVLQADAVSPRRWRELVGGLGMKSLLGRCVG